MASEVYPNSGLSEVIFELRFNGEPAIECQRDIFFEFLRGKYPKVHVPLMESGKAPALEFYKFENTSKDARVLLSINRLAISSSKYIGFADFRMNIIEVMKCFRKAYKVIDKLTRVGLRYQNIIKFVREEGTVPIERYLNLNLKLPDAIPGKYMFFETAFVSKTEGGTITTKLQPMMAKDGSHEALLLDFDHAMEGGELRIGNYDLYLKESHEYTKKMFEQLITEEYKRYLRGEVVK